MDELHNCGKTQTSKNIITINPDKKLTRSKIQVVFLFSSQRSQNLNQPLEVQVLSLQLLSPSAFRKLTIKGYLVCVFVRL